MENGSCKQFPLISPMTTLVLYSLSKLGSVLLLLPLSSVCARIFTLQGHSKLEIHPTTWCAYLTADLSGDIRELVAVTKPLSLPPEGQYAPAGQVEELAHYLQDGW